jgi:hypothetical protein
MALFEMFGKSPDLGLIKQVEQGVRQMLAVAAAYLPAAPHPITNFRTRRTARSPDGPLYKLQ